MKQIVVIDDESQLVELMARAINSKKDHYQAFPFSDPEVAVQWMKSGNRFDLVIVDMNMPNMNGIQVANEIKEMGINIPVIVSTGDSGNEHELKETFDYILPKPYRRKMLFHMLDTILMGDDKQE